jgi:protein TonB
MRMVASVAPVLDAYGAAELKQVRQRYMTWAVGLAGLVHLAGVGIWWASEHFGAEAPPERTVRIMKYSELGPPPSISSANAPAAVAVELPKVPVKPKIAVPVPVPDEQVPVEQTIPTQEELAAPVADVADAGTGTAVQQDIDLGAIQDDGPPPEFVPFEKEPAVVQRVEPQYPEAAKQNGIEGAVFAKLWIDKEGKVKQVVILKSPSPLFEPAVIDAAKQWVFTPAVMNSGPVAVWFPVKFSFHLQG